MMAEALVTPPTFYFENPAELYAEGMKLYRLSASAREHLEKVSPRLYEIIKRDNQREIDFPKLGSLTID
jgi:exonuclease VII small subunit